MPIHRDSAIWSDRTDDIRGLFAFPTVEFIAAKRSVVPEVLRLQNIYRVSFSDEISPEAFASRIARLPGVVYAESIYPAQLDGLPFPEDPHFSEDDTPLPYLDRLKLADAWNTVKGEDGNVIIAINDTGVDMDHADLADNLWTNSDEVPNNGIDDDNSGYIDYVHGWNFRDRNGNPNPYQIV